ncbi:MAG: 2-oxoacid:acceptor oxidoreductase family protein [Adlercreutzia equolifaciens]
MPPPCDGPSGEATGSDDISVIVFRSPCVLLERHVEPPLFVSDSCTACGACVTLGCPALGRDETGRALIDPALCIGCGHCTQYCRFDANRQANIGRPFMENATKTVLLCGVGGQGTILAADLLAFSRMKAGLQVKVSEIHGTAQRGAPSPRVVRVGEDVKSMVSDAGCADVVVAFETTGRPSGNLPQLKEGGPSHRQRCGHPPLPVLTGAASMPENAPGAPCARPGRSLIDADAIARAAGNATCANVVLVGALAARPRHSRRGVEETVAERASRRRPSRRTSRRSRARAEPSSVNEEGK